MIEFSQGNMFTDRYDILVNTVNCVGAMGKGVALEFKNLYPSMYEAYRIQCQRGEILPGQLTEWKPQQETATTPGTIINFPTKRHYRDNSRYEDIDAGLIALREYLLPLGTVSVGLPPLGCGNGGLDWTIVSKMILERLVDLDATIVAFEPRSEVVVIEDVEEAPVEKVKVKAKSKPKEKKRPSDFEITRTILQRTHERKLPYLLKDMGEDSDIWFFCSKDEGEFTYGSPDITIGIFEFTDPELITIIDGTMSKLYGLNRDLTQQRIINVRDQISELSKTKGESIDVEVAENEYGSAWVTKTNIREQEQTVYYSKGLDSLFHMQVVKHWCKIYRPLLTTQDPAHLYYEYRHPEGVTASILALPIEDENHPLAKIYPHGLRTMVTRGLDVILDKFLEDLPYPVLKEEVIVFQDQSTAVQIAHRILAQGWQMILLRPNAMFFPTVDTVIPLNGNHSL